MVIKKIVRGCGTRVPGGLYVRVATMPLGLPMEHFMIDAPAPYLGGSNRAPFFQGDDAFFWVGSEEGYPYTADFLEESRNYGISKRIPLGGDLKKYKPFETRLFFIHPKAVVSGNFPVDQCPKDKPTHFTGQERCIRALYYLMDKKDVTESGTVITRTVGSTTYEIPKLLPLDGLKFSPGICLWLPFSNFEYILPLSKVVDPRIEEAIRQGINILVVDESED